MSKTEILNNFEETLRSLSSINVISFKSIPKLIIENEFKSFVSDHLNNIISLDGSDQNISNKILENKIPSKLESLLKSIIDCKEFFSNNTENDYSKQLNDIKNITDKQLQFRHMQQLLELILKNVAFKKNIEDGLWEAYFEIQKICDSLPSKANQESMTNYLYQVQADPLKRAFYIMFTAFFELYAREKYIESKGNVNIDQSVDIPEEQKESGLAKHYRHLRGVPFPAP